MKSKDYFLMCRELQETIELTGPFITKLLGRFDPY